jgi:hypothetical protein
LTQLKGIKPRKEWAVLLKSQILSPKQVGSPEVKAQSVGFMNTLSFIFSPRKLVYAFSAVLFLVIGVFGFAKYTVPGDLLFPVKKIAEQSQAALSGQTTLKHEVALLNNRINDLVQVAKDGRVENIPSTISEINANASQLAKNLKENVAGNKQALKDISISLKTLANVPGTDLTANKDVKDLYQVVVESQIVDLEKTTLTDEQEITLEEIKELYNQEKYTDALEKILLINQ